LFRPHRKRAGTAGKWDRAYASGELCVEAVMQGPGNSAYEQICRRPSGKRYYGGCEVVDEIEQLAIDRVKELFGGKLG